MPPARATTQVRPPARPEPIEPFNAVKVFSSTSPKTRDELGELITRWLRAHPEITVADFAVRQSSGLSHHCLTICLFYRMGKPRDTSADPVRAL